MFAELRLGVLKESHGDGAAVRIRSRESLGSDVQAARYRSRSEAGNTPFCDQRERGLGDTIAMERRAGSLRRSTLSYGDRVHRQHTRDAIDAAQKTSSTAVTAWTAAAAVDPSA